MTYNPSIPQGNQTIASSQPGILTNFTQLNTAIGVDHVALSPSSANQGKHNKCSFVAQGSDPASQSNTVLLYSKVVGGVTDLYVRDSTEDGGGIYKLTEDGSTGTVVNALNGRSFMPGGIVVQWGRNQINNGSSSVTVPFLAPIYTNVWSITATPINVTGSTIQDNTPSISGMTGTNFVINRRVTSGNVMFNWIAIGS